MTTITRNRPDPLGVPAARGPSAPAAAPVDPPAGRRTEGATDVVEHGGTRAGGTELPSAATTTRTGRTAALRALVPLAAGVELGRNGLLVQGRTSSRDAGITQGSVGVLEEAARAFGRVEVNPYSKLNSSQRRQVVEHLRPFLMCNRDDTGRDSSLALRSRAAAFALLVPVFTAMRPSEGKARSDLAQQLLDGAAAERNDGLRRHMTLGLDLLPTRSLSVEQTRLREKLVAERAPPAPPYDKWFAGKEKPVFQVRQYVMDEFFKAEISAYKQAGFDIKHVSGARVVATKLLEDPTGKNQPVLAKVELLQRDTNVLDTMADPDVHMVLYSGHSQLGAVGKISVENAPSQKGDKIVGMFACRTKQNLPGLRRQFPTAHLLVSANGTYGHDDRIVIQKLFEGIGRRASYAEMEASAEKKDLWEKNNYIFPHDKEQWRHIDHDRDGTVDVSGGQRDLLHDIGLKRRSTDSLSFKPARKVPDVTKLDGAKVTDAVAWFNTEFFYWTEDFGNRKETARADRFVSDGWFKSDNPDEIVRVEKSGGKDPVWRVKVNAAYAHLDADAVAAMTTYALAMEQMKETRPAESEYDRRMRALAMVGSYVYYHVEFSNVADSLLGNFGKRFGFPPTLTWPVVEKAIGADSHAEASEKVVRQLEKGMQFPFLEVNPARSTLAFRTEVSKALEALRTSRSDVARATFDAIVSGRVKVDTLSDLTKPDFLRLRKELIVDGADIDIEEFMQLHDERSEAMRAITSAIDGYMWDDRVYIAMGRSPKDLATTLIHEVNHVLNKSEEKYRTTKDVLTEEYRARYAEALFTDGRTPDRARCRALKEGVIEDYKLAGVTPADVTDVPPGVIVPG